MPLSGRGERERSQVALARGFFRAKASWRSGSRTPPVWGARGPKPGEWSEAERALQGGMRPRPTMRYTARECLQAGATPRATGATSNAFAPARTTYTTDEVRPKLRASKGLKMSAARPGETAAILPCASAVCRTET